MNIFLTLLGSVFGACGRQKVANMASKIDPKNDFERGGSPLQWPAKPPTPHCHGLWFALGTFFRRFFASIFGPPFCKVFQCFWNQCWFLFSRRSKNGRHAFRIGFYNTDSGFDLSKSTSKSNEIRSQIALRRRRPPE